MNPFYIDHLQRHAAAIRYLPPANKKPAAHQLCNKLLTTLIAANEARYVQQPAPFNI